MWKSKDVNQADSKTLTHHVLSQLKERMKNLKKKDDGSIIFFLMLKLIQKTHLNKVVVRTLENLEGRHSFSCC